MALKTFTNLPEKRRKEILDRCFIEFAEKGYAGASIAAIISDLGLARGSFYRYFEDKKHLYRYLYTRAMEMSLGEYAQNTAGDTRDFLEVWKSTLMKYVKISGAFPVYMHFLSRASQERRPEIYMDPKTRGFDKKIDFVESYLIDGRKKGKIRDDVDPRLMALVFLHSRYSLSQYMILRTEKRKTRPRTKEYLDILEDTLDGYIKLLRHGFAKNGKEK